MLRILFSTILLLGAASAFAQNPANVEYNGGTCATSFVVDPGGNVSERITLTDGQTCGLTFNQPTGSPLRFILKIVQSPGGSGSISGCKWDHGAVPLITQQAGAVDMFEVYLDGVSAYCKVWAQDSR